MSGEPPAVSHGRVTLVSDSLEHPGAHSQIGSVDRKWRSVDPEWWYNVIRSSVRLDDDLITNLPGSQWSPYDKHGQAHDALSHRDPVSAAKVDAMDNPQGKSLLGEGQVVSLVACP